MRIITVISKYDKQISVWTCTWKVFLCAHTHLRICATFAAAASSFSSSAEKVSLLLLTAQLLVCFYWLFVLLLWRHISCLYTILSFYRLYAVCMNNKKHGGSINLMLSFTYLTKRKVQYLQTFFVCRYEDAIMLRYGCEVSVCARKRVNTQKFD